MGVVGLVVLVVILLALRRFSRQDDARYAEEDAAVQRAELDVRRRELEHARHVSAMQQALSTTHTAAARALESHRRSLDLVHSADLWLAKASRHREASAFTPFWEACENAMMALDAHRSAVAEMRVSAASYREALAVLVYGDPSLVPQAGAYPTEIGETATIDAGTRVAARVAETIYSAQSNFRFASIFEQRRTTAAVASGFRTFTESVDGMASAIRDSYEALASTIHEVGAETARVRRTISTGFDSLSPSILATPDSLGHQVHEINRNLERIANKQG